MHLVRRTFVARFAALASQGEAFASTLDRTRAWIRAGIVVTFVLLAAGPVAASEPDVGRARDAYDRGVRAHAAGDHAAAAKAFAEADDLAPTMASLEAALEAAMRADDAVLGAQLLERSASRPERDASLSRSIEAARKRFEGRTGMIRVDCRSSSTCLVSIDGRASDASKPIVVMVGTHTLVVQRDEERFERLVEVLPGGVARVTGSDGMAATLPTTPSRPVPVKPSPSGISPVWFFIGLGATTVAGTLATLSGVDANKMHDSFESAGCSIASSGPKASDCAARSDQGASATLRTNLLLGATALLAVNTAIAGTFFVRWSSSPSGGVATMGGSFK